MVDTFGIGVLAERTGLSAGQLRTWENRFGFPRGERMGNGHRRFSDVDVTRVQRVLEARASGLPLAVAIDSVVGHDDVAQHPNVFGAISSRFASIRTERLDRHAMTRLSRALEDECLARADGDLVLGAFQTREHYERSRDRWRELARTATWCAVVADFGSEKRPVAGEPVFGQLAPEDPMRREWTVITLGASHGAVLSGWEIDGRGEREFEAVVSLRPAVAQVAAQTLVGVLTRSGVRVPVEVERRLSAPAVPPEPEAADRLLGRALGYLVGEAGR